MGLGPISAFMPELITGASGILGQGINALAQSANNRKMREWNEKMYGMQRQHSLQDWQMQNA
jgi:hypothetical protein